MQRKNLCALFVASAILLVTITHAALTPALIVHAAVETPSFAPSIPAADLLNRDGTLNLTKGKAAAVDIRGWNVRLDPHRGPVLAPQAVASQGWSSLDNGVNIDVLALAVSGSDVYVGGYFVQVCGNLACNSGNITVNYIAKWNGATNSWTSLGHGLTSYVYALAVSGSDLYVGGDFTAVCGNLACNSGNVVVNRVVKWNGSSWSPLGYGVGNSVSALAVSGSEVYVGGLFNQVCGNSTCSSGNVMVQHIAKWNGSSWSPLGYGVNQGVEALAVSGSDVYVGGGFTTVCGDEVCGSSIVPVNHIAKWNGSSFSALGYGVDNVVGALAVSGSDVYVGGYFGQVCGNWACNGGNVTVNRIVKWNGSSFSALDNGLNNFVRALVASGNDVYVGGEFNSVCGNSVCNSGNMRVNAIAKWNGNRWSASGYGVNGDVNALTASGNIVYVGGAFTAVCADSACISGNTSAHHIATWSPFTLFLPFIER